MNPFLKFRWARKRKVEELRARIQKLEERVSKLEEWFIEEHGGSGDGVEIPMGGDVHS